MPELQGPLPDALVRDKDPRLAINSSMSRKLSEKQTLTLGQPIQPLPLQ